MVKVILFDFYGVFLPDAYSAWLQQNGHKRAGIFVDLMNDLDMGKSSEAVFLARLSKAAGREVGKDEIHSKATDPDQGVVELAQALRATYKIGLLSNASKKLRPKLHDLGLVELFDTIVISSEIGHAKPSDTAFQIALQKLGAAASEVFFIDDNSHNVEVAKRNGIQAVQYTSLSDLQKTLEEQGLLTSRN